MFKGQVYNIPEPETDEPIGTSPLGTPIFDDLTFPADQYTNLFGDVIALEEVKLQSVLISVNRSKHVVKTPVQGRDGTVKEYISSGDFIISVSGVIASNDNTFPEVEAENLRLLCDANAALSVISSYLNDVIGVGHVVIDSDSYRQMRGTRNSIEIGFTCSSDVSRDIEELIIE